MATKKSKGTKTAAAKEASPKKRSVKRGVSSYQDHEFIIITGGGFLIAVLALVLFF